MSSDPSKGRLLAIVAAVGAVIILITVILFVIDF